MYMDVCALTVVMNKKVTLCTWMSVLLTVVIHKGYTMYTDVCALTVVIHKGYTMYTEV